MVEFFVVGNNRNLWIVTVILYSDQSTQFLLLNEKGGEVNFLSLSMYFFLLLFKKKSLFKPQKITNVLFNHDDDTSVILFVETLGRVIANSDCKI